MSENRDGILLKRPVLIYPTGLVIVAGSNALSIFVLRIVNVLVFTDAELAFLSPVQLTWWSVLGGFALPVACTIALFVPIYRALRRRRAVGGPLGAAEIGRIARFPAAGAGLSVLGWLVAQLPTLLAEQWYGLSVPPELFWLDAAMVVAACLFIVVFSLFAFEVVFRRSVYPVLFQEHASGSGGEFTEPPSGGVPTTLSIRARLLMLVTAISLIPLMFGVLFGLQLLREDIVADRALVFIGFSAGAAVLGAVLAVLFARAVGTPIAEIAGSARAVGRGEFSISVPVRSNDEIGALAGSFNRMVAGLREREYIRETFGRVVAPEVRDHILESGGGLRGSRATATVLFFDIQGYTGALEGMDAEAAVSWLNRVFAVCSHHVSGHGGTIDKFIGDAVLAVFGVPRPTPDAAARAVAAARAIRDGLAELSGRLGGEGLPPVGFGIGVHSGTVVAGTIGSPERMEYTVIGDTVNVAARIEGMTRTLDRTILLSEATVRAANAANDGRIEPMGTHQLRGRRESIALFAG